MIDSLNPYTAAKPGRVIEVSPLSLMTVEPFTEEATNSGAAFAFPDKPWYIRFDFPREFDRSPSNNFIGILTDGEAKEMKAGIDMFKKRFDDDLARRNKILFGE